MAYLNCPECFYRVRTPMARELDGETSCPRCSRLGRLVSMYATEMSLRPGPDERVAPLSLRRGAFARDQQAV
jgi:uncharacterized Zn finger protein (UPF0148 family)